MKNKKLENYQIRRFCIMLNTIIKKVHNNNFSVSQNNKY